LHDNLAKATKPVTEVSIVDVDGDAESKQDEKRQSTIDFDYQTIANPPMDLSGFTVPQ